MQFSRYSFFGHLSALSIAVATLLSSTALGQLSYTGGTVTENFDSMGSSGTNTPPGWWVGWMGTMTTYSTNLLVNDGSIGLSSTAGWNFGSTGSEDRALGTMATGSSTPTPPGAHRFIEVQFRNDTEVNIVCFRVQYDGEEWRSGGTPVATTTLAFQVSTNGTSFSSPGGTFDFLHPVLTPANTALDGNAPANRVAGLGGIYQLPNPLPPGGILYLRWYDYNDPVVDPGLAIDNFSFTAFDIRAPAITSQPQSTSVPYGSTVRFSAGISGDAPLTVQWLKNGNPLSDDARIQGANTAQLKISQVNAGDLGEYNLMLNNAAGAVTSAAVRLTFTPPDFVWARQTTGGGGSSAGSISVNASGNTVVAGYFRGTISFGGQSLTSEGNNDVYVVDLDTNGSPTWLVQIRGVGDITATCAAIADSGDVYVAGAFTGNCNFGPTNLTSVAGQDVFVAKYGPGGNFQWVRQGAGTGDKDEPDDIAVDKEGNCYVTGAFGFWTSSVSTFNLAGTVLTGLGDRAIYLAKFDPDGNLLWVHVFDSTSSDIGTSVALDAHTNVYLGGWFANTVNFGADELSSAGYWDIYTAKYDSAGAPQWARRVGTSLYNEGHSIAVDAVGNACAIGNEFANWNNWRVPLLYVVRYDPNGNQEWLKRITGSLYLNNMAIAMDGMGNCYAAGGFSGTANFDNYKVSSRGSCDLFIAKYDRLGTLQWVKTAGQSGEAGAVDLAIDRNGDCLAFGRFTATVDFGVTSLSTSVTNVFLARLATSTELPQLSIWPALADNGLALNITGPLGSYVLIQAADDFAEPVSWTTICKLNLNTIPSRFVDTSGSQRSHRFYRVCLRP